MAAGTNCAAKQSGLTGTVGIEAPPFGTNEQVGNSLVPSGIFRQRGQWPSIQIKDESTVSSRPMRVVATDIQPHRQGDSKSGI